MDDFGQCGDGAADEGRLSGFLGRTMIVIG
jgi:hypothetical protein